MRLPKGAELTTGLNRRECVEPDVRLSRGCDAAFGKVNREGVELTGAWTFRVRMRTAYPRVYSLRERQLILSESKGALNSMYYPWFT